MKLDLKDFHKVETSDTFSILAHPSGHKMKVAHKGLSEEMRKQLEEMPVKLAKGGYAKYAQKYDPSMKSKASKPSQASKPAAGPTNLVPKQASKAYTEPEDQGTDVVLAALNREAPPFGPLGTEQKQHLPPCINPSCKSFGRPHPNCKCYGGTGGSVGEAGHFAEGGKVGDYCSENRDHKPGCEYRVMRYADGTPNEPVPSPTPSFGENAKGEQMDPVEAQYGYEDFNADPKVYGGEKPTEQPEQQPVPMAGEAVGQPPSSPEPAREPTEQPTETATAAPEQKAQTFEQHKQADTDHLVKHYQLYENDVNSGNIKPETYHDLFAKKDTLGKIGTLFGLLIGGAGAGLTGQENPVLKMMSQQIQNDNEAQQKSSSNKQNFLRINQEGLMKEANKKSLDQETSIKANALNWAKKNYTAYHSLADSVSKLPPGPQRQQAEQALAVVYQGMTTENSNIIDKAAAGSAWMKTMGIGTEGNGTPDTRLMKSGILGPEAAKIGDDTEQKTIPGIPGVAKIPIEPKDRDQIQAMNVLDNKAADLLSFIKQHRGTLNPQTRAVATQKAEEMMNYYNNSIQGGVLTQGRLGWLDQQIGKKPLSLVQDLMGNSKRLEEVKNSNAMRRDLLLKKVGLNPLSKTKTSDPQDQIKVVNGVKYKRGPNGEAIKVD